MKAVVIVEVGEHAGGAKFTVVHIDVTIFQSRHTEAWGEESDRIKQESFVNRLIDRKS